jgi:hypothetical protein
VPDDAPKKKRHYTRRKPKKEEPAVADASPPQKQAAPPRGSLPPYPADFPADAVPMVIDALRGNVPDPKEACHAAWAVAGFGLGKWDVHPPPVFKGAAPAMTREQAAAELEKAARPLAGDTPGARAAAVPWGVILPVLLGLAQELLKKWLGG